MVGLAQNYKCELAALAGLAGVVRDDFHSSQPPGNILMRIRNKLECRGLIRVVYFTSVPAKTVMHLRMKS